MVIALNYKLLHLADGVLTSIRHMLGNIRYLSPYYHTVLVAKIIKILIVLIMRKTDSICTDLADHLHINIVMLLGYGISDALPVLMTANATQRIGLTVKEEACVRVNTEGTATEFARNLVLLYPADTKNCLAGVKIGIFYSVPKMDLLDNDCLIGIVSCADCFPIGIL